MHACEIRFDLHQEEEKTATMTQKPWVTQKLTTIALANTVQSYRSATISHQVISICTTNTVHLTRNEIDLSFN